MSAPNILYYAWMMYDQMSKKTPKYVITAEAGYYYPMEALKGRDGKISMFLAGKLTEGANVPAMRLQAKDSLNFTGLKELFTTDGKISGYAYGYPLQSKTYSSKGKPNPFYECRGDGFLFVVHNDTPIKRTDGSTVPSCIELIVLEGAKVTVAAYCKQLRMGGYASELAALRRQAGVQVF